MQADFARSGEGDVARLGMRDDSVAEAGSGAGAEVDHALGHSGFFEQFEELRGDRRRVARGLQDDGVAADDRGQRHAGHDGAGEVPRRNHRADAERNVVQRVVLAGQLDGRLRLGEAQRFARVELAEVDGLGDVGVGFSPVLADFEDQPGHEFHLALAHECRRRGTARLARSSTVVRLQDSKGLERGLHRWLDVLFAGLLVDADNLATACDGFSDLILSAVLTRLPPMMRSYSRPSWPRTLAMAARMRRAFSSLRKS